MTLESALDSLVAGNRISICIEDLAGILFQPKLALPSHYTAHSTPFCKWVKKHNETRWFCTSCKLKSVKKAMQTGLPFSGRCHMGLREAVYPLIIDGMTVAVIFVGNMAESGEAVKKRAERAAVRSALADMPDGSLFGDFFISENPDPLFKIAGFIAEFMLSLYDKSIKNPYKVTHWAVESVKSYISHHYDSDISIKKLAKMYYFNASYLGQLFKKHTGRTVAEYTMYLKIENAIALLLETDRSVTDISASCGFNNITYFNRKFKASTGLSPTEYRRENKKSPAR